MEEWESLIDEETKEEFEVIDRNTGFELPEGKPKPARRDTFVGTPLYVSPEMLLETRSLPASDLWALGCIIYKMYYGEVPFRADSETLTYDKILARDLQFPDTVKVPEDAKDLIERLL